MRAPRGGNLRGFRPSASSDRPPLPARPWTAAFVKRLRELGWIESRTVAIAYRWAEGRPARAYQAASDFARDHVEVIVTNGTSLVLAARRAAPATPIVFAAAGDPIGTGLVESLARPGGNLTGSSLQATELAGKHLELLREVRPGAKRLAMLVNMDASNAVLQLQEMMAASELFGFDFEAVEIRRAEDIAPALEGLGGRADVLFVANEPLTVTHRERINALALAAKLPTMYAFREFVDSGGLISYGPSFPDLFRRAADFVDKILRGAKPADLPVEQPTSFAPVVNLKTARALGLELPPMVVARADEVID